MFRILNFVSVIALLAAAGAVYHVKYSSAFEAQKIAKLRGEIRYERDRIATLNAEWARRTAPDRIQSQAEHHLDMQPLDVERMDKLASLPAKPDQSADPLSGMIEALVDGPNPAPQAAIPVKPTAAKPVAFARAPPPTSRCRFRPCPPPAAWWRRVPALPDRRARSAHRSTRPPDGPCCRPARSASKKRNRHHVPFRRFLHRLEAPCPARQGSALPLQRGA